MRVYAYTLRATAVGAAAVVLLPRSRGPGITRDLEVRTPPRHRTPVKPKCANSFLRFCTCVKARIKARK